MQSYFLLIIFEWKFACTNMQFCLSIWQKRLCLTRAVAYCFQQIICITCAMARKKKSFLILCRKFQFSFFFLVVPLEVETKWIMVLSWQTKHFVSENLICKCSRGFFWTHISNLYSSSTSLWWEWNKHSTSKLFAELTDLTTSKVNGCWQNDLEMEIH